MLLKPFLIKSHSAVTGEDHLQLVCPINISIPSSSSSKKTLLLSNTKKNLNHNNQKKYKHHQRPHTVNNIQRIKNETKVN